MMRTRFVYLVCCWLVLGGSQLLGQNQGNGKLNITNADGDLETGILTIAGQFFGAPDPVVALEGVSVSFPAANLTVDTYMEPSQLVVLLPGDIESGDYSVTVTDSVDPTRQDTQLVTLVSAQTGSQGPAKLEIHGAEPDLLAGTVLISGANLGDVETLPTDFEVSLFRPDPLMAVAGIHVPLSVTAFDPSIQGIIAMLPSEIFPGTFSLTVKKGNETDTIEVTLDDDLDLDPANEVNTNVILNGTALEVTDAGGTLSADLSSLTDDSDWTVSGADMHSSISGNVGIGTANPQAKLHVFGNLRVANGNVGIGTMNPLGVFQVRPGPDQNLLIRSLTGVGTSIESFNDAATQNLRLEFRGAPTVFSTGNVGIGTLTPSSALTVTNTTGPIAQFLGENHNSYGDSSTRVWIEDASGGVGWYLSANNEGSFSIHQGAVGDRVRIDDNTGNVGIGTIFTLTPITAKLDVDGDANIRGTLTVNGVQDNDHDPANEFNTALTLNGTSLEIADSGGTLSADLGVLVADADANASNELNTGLALNGTSLEITDAGGTLSADLGSLLDDSDWTVSGNDMHASVAGNVGVGTANPQAKLHVLGNLRVANGNVGIGTMNPLGTFQVRPGPDQNLLIRSLRGVGTSIESFNDAETENRRLELRGAPTVFMAGDVGIGPVFANTSLYPVGRLDVDGNANIRGNLDVTGGTTVNGDLAVNGTLHARLGFERYERTQGGAFNHTTNSEIVALCDPGDLALSGSYVCTSGGVGECSGLIYLNTGLVTQDEPVLQDGYSVYGHQGNPAYGSSLVSVTVRCLGVTQLPVAP